MLLRLMRPYVLFPDLVHAYCSVMCLRAFYEILIYVSSTLTLEALSSGNKPNSIDFLISRLHQIYCEAECSKTLKTIWNSLQENGYPDSFQNNMNTSRRQRYPEVPKNTACVRVANKGEATAEVSTHRISNAVGKSFHVVKPRLTFTRQLSIRLKPKSKLRKLSTSSCLYSYSYSFGVEWVDRTSRCLSNRVQEHYLA